MGRRKLGLEQGTAILVFDVKKGLDYWAEDVK